MACLNHSIACRNNLSPIIKIHSHSCSLWLLNQCAITVRDGTWRIGIVVDDAIVVASKMSRNIENESLNPREATYRAMREVSGPIIAIALTLVAVFVPLAFIDRLNKDNSINNLP